MLTNLTNFALNHECILIHYSNRCSNEYFCIPSNMLKEVGFFLLFKKKKKSSANSLYSLIKIQLITNTIKPLYHSLQKTADGSKVVNQRSNREQ